MASAALYAATITNPTTAGNVPEDSKAKKHHLKDGKGFTNPWDSWIEKSGPGMFVDIFRYVTAGATASKGDFALYQ